jgi:hypothetical protein
VIENNRPTSSAPQTKKGCVKERRVFFGQGDFFFKKKGREGMRGVGGKRRQAAFLLGGSFLSFLRVVLGSFGG